LTIDADASLLPRAPHYFRFRHFADAAAPLQLLHFDAAWRSPSPRALLPHRSLRRLPPPAADAMPAFRFHADDTAAADIIFFRRHSSPCLIFAAAGAPLSRFSCRRYADAMLIALLITPPMLMMPP